MPGLCPGPHLGNFFSKKFPKDFQKTLSYFYHHPRKGDDDENHLKFLEILKNLLERRFLSGV